MPPPNRKIPIRTIQVWAHNVESEFKTIRSLIDNFPNVSMDTEFPGVVVKPPLYQSAPRSPKENYRFLKANVDRLKLIQIGLTLSDDAGNLPGHGEGIIWEFNFRDFDAAKDLHAQESVELLRDHGMDFARNRQAGVEVARFAELMMSSGLICNTGIRWVTFHGGYDFGYLVKGLTQRPLPERLGEFLELVELYFGSSVIDLKHVIRYCNGLMGGLNRVCDSIGVARLVGESHQAGSDSLLTWHAFHKISLLYFSRGVPIHHYANVLYGLEIF